MGSSDFQIVSAAELAGKSDPALTARSVGPKGQTPIQVYTAQDAFVLGSPGVIGLRRGPATRIFAESSPYPDTVAMLAREAFAKAPGAVENFAAACLLDRLWAGNIWHWFMESLPVVAALEEARFEGCYIVPGDSTLCADSLGLLDIPLSRIRLGRQGFCAVTALVFTESFHGYNLAKWPWVVEWVRARARRHFPQEPGARRVYIARRGTRRVLNEVEIMAKLAEQGFVTAYMEDLSLRDQLCLLRDAQIVIGPHGAGLVHTMFMPKGGTLIEFFNARYVNPCMVPVCEILDIDYRMLVSQVNPMDNFRKDDLILVQWEPFLLALKSALRV